MLASYLNGNLRVHQINATWRSSLGPLASFTLMLIEADTFRPIVDGDNWRAIALARRRSIDLLWMRNCWTLNLTIYKCVIFVISPLLWFVFYYSWPISSVNFNYLSYRLIWSQYISQGIVFKRLLMIACFLVQWTIFCTKTSRTFGWDRHKLFESQEIEDYRKRFCLK